MGNILENNKLIAEFMQYGVFEHFTNTHGYGRVRNEELLFHKDWNWLMEVVEKIESLGFEVNIKGISCKIQELLNDDEIIVSLVLGDKAQKIHLVFMACVEFIKWHNQQK